MISWITILLIIGFILLIWYNENNKIDNGMWTYQRFTKRFEWSCNYYLAVVITMILACIIGNVKGLKDKQTIQQKIDYLEEYNASIDNELKTTVMFYMEYEQEIMDKDLTALVLVNAYPELKANELIAKQIEVYVENESLIKKYKMSQIDNTFWLKVWCLW